MSGKHTPASKIGRVAAVVRRHFADPTFYARRYRASVGARDALLPPRRPVAGDGPFRFMTWWLPRPRRGGAPPDALERWMARPAVFVPTLPLGLAILAAKLDVARDAPLLPQVTVAAGVLVAWLGLTGGVAYVERRWPRTEPVLIAGAVLLSVAGILCGNRGAVGQLLAQVGSWTLISLAIVWRQHRPGRGGG